jgi:Lipoxygenase
MADESNGATDATGLKKEFEGFAEKLATDVLAKVLARVDASNEAEAAAESAPTAEAEAGGDASEVKVTVTGKVKGVFSPQVKATIRGNGELKVRVLVFSEDVQLPAFLIPDAMTPASADVGEQESKEALAEAMIEQAVELVIQGWKEVGWRDLLRALRSFRLPLWLFGLKDIPAIPVELLRMIPTLLRLLVRLEQKNQAADGLNTSYTIGGRSAFAYEFMYGSSDSDLGSGSASAPDTTSDSDSDSGQVRNQASSEARDTLNQLVADLDGDSTAGKAGRILRLLREAGGAISRSGSLTQLPLDDPRQWSMSWTTWPPIYQQSRPLLDGFAATLTDADEASRRFWPTLADYGLAYNLMMLSRVDSDTCGHLEKAFGDAWDGGLDDAAKSGRLYVIDLSIYEGVETYEADGEVRFTPATITLLEQDPESKWLTPVAIRVAGKGGVGAETYTRASATASAWLYALQAAKVSITVYGIWLGHVYQWHIVTAAMQMTMFANVPESHPIYQLLAPQFKYLIPFDDVLLVTWKAIAPPTSITSGWQFLELCNAFAKNREFFDDDPSALADRGVKEADFTVDAPWDRYLIVRRYQQIWKATADYVTTFVDVTYADNQAVAEDTALQAWIADSSDPYGGNVHGLPKMNSRAALKQVLTSLLYRIAAHGMSRLSPVANPGLTFVANYPPCLQDATIPEPSRSFDTRALLSYMPRTGTIGLMANFYFVFSFSPPYESFIPITGVESELFFPSGLADPRNHALVAYRQAMIEIMKKIEGSEIVQLFQLPLNVET